MSTGPIDNNFNGKTITPLEIAGQDKKEASPTTTKPKVKPPLERPFSLSLPPEKSVAETVVKNIDESNKETERLTKKTADEQKLQQIVEEQQAQDKLLNGPGMSGA